MQLTLCFLLLTAVKFTLTEDFEDEPLPDYYAILKVSHTATVKEIKKSFRILAMKYHPDKNKDEGAQEIFKELSEAYSILSDQEKKAEYDELYTMDSGDHEHSETKDDVTEEEFSEQNGSENKEDSSSAWGDLDDETVYRVLRFLADHDYEITKKKVYRAQEHNAEQQYSGSRYSEQSHKAHSHKQYSYNAHSHKEYAHKEHVHNPWMQDPELKYSHSYGSTHGSIPAQHYCRTTVSWEGATRVTLKSCF